MEVETPVCQVDGAGRDHNTEHEGKVGPVRTGMGSTGHAGEVGVDETGTVVGVLAPQMEVYVEDVGLRRPSGVVRGHSQFGWSHRSTWIDRLREDFRTKGV